MQESVEALLKLWDQDRQLLAWKRELKQIPTRAKKMGVNLRAVEKHLSELESKEAELNQSIQERETLIKVEKLRVPQSEERMRMVNNQREYVAIKKEIEAALKLTRDMEDEIQELEKKKEAFAPELGEVKQERQELLVGFNKDKQALLEEQEKIDIQCKEAVQQKAALEEQSDPNLLRQYRDLLNQNLVPTIAVINQCYCPGCSTKVMAQTFNMIIRDTVGNCPHCNRILVYQAPPKVEVEVEEEKPKKKTRKKATKKKVEVDKE